MTSRNELLCITSRALSHKAKEKARRDAARDLSDNLRKADLVEKATNNIQLRLLTAAKAGRLDAKIFEWKYGDGVEIRWKLPPINPTSAAGLVLAYCSQHHSDLRPEVRHVDYRPTRPFGPYRHVWGLFLSWA